MVITLHPLQQVRAASLHSERDSWKAHWIRAAHPMLVTIKHDTAAFVVQGTPLPAGTQSARLRPGPGGHAWNAD